MPALEKANCILTKISENPNKLKMIDLSKELNLNKSSVYTLLSTMVDMGWVIKKENKTYELGPYFYHLNQMLFNKSNVVQNFYKMAPKYSAKVGETIQLGVLKGTDVLYLGRIDAVSTVRLVTDPGATFPAYASAIGKIQMIDVEEEEIRKRFSKCSFEKKTTKTTSSIDELYDKVQSARKKQIAIENEESAIGFHCVAAPIYNYEGKIAAGVSFSMQTENWYKKFDLAAVSIQHLAEELSFSLGFN